MAAAARFCRPFRLELHDPRCLPRTVGRPLCGGRVRIGGGLFAEPVLGEHLEGGVGVTRGVRRGCHSADRELGMAPERGERREREGAVRTLGAVVIGEVGSEVQQR